MRTASRRRHASGPRPLVELLERRDLLAGAGALDPAFGGGRGYVIDQAGQTTDFNQRNFTTVSGVFTQPGGKVVVALVAKDAMFGTGTSEFLLDRLNADGTPDATFGQGGVLTVPVPYPTGYGAGTVGNAVLMQPDGKILEVGSMAVASPPAGSPTETYAVLRINVNGSIDTTYGKNGLATFPAGTTGGLASVGSAALQPNGDLVLDGTGNIFATTGLATTFISAVRLNADGSLDTSFGTGGTATTSLATIAPSESGMAGPVAIQPDGGIILAASFVLGGGTPDSSATVNLVRLDPGGKPDPAFGSKSASAPGVLYGVGNFLFGLAAQPDNRIVAVTSSRTMAFAPLVASLDRLNADGSSDASFGTGGQVVTPLTGPVAIGADGKIVVGGGIVPGVNFARFLPALARFNPNGSPDASFGNTSTPGLARYNFGAATNTAGVGALAIQPDGNILLAGGVTAAYFSPGQPQFDQTHFAVARALGQASTGAAALPPPPTPPASFDGTGRTDLAVYLPAAGAFAYRPTNVFAGDQIIPFGLPGPGQTLPAAADYAGIGQTQIAAYLPAYGDYAIRPADGGPDQVFPFGIAGPGQSIPAPADYEGTGKADVAVYLPAFGAFGIRPSDGSPDRIVPFGFAGPGRTIPAPGDYTGDGKADVAAYLPALGAFAIRPSEGGPDQILPFGLAGPGRSIPAPGDYDGSGRTELAVYLPTLGLFAYRPARGGPDVLIPFGAPNFGEIPAPGDYSGSGHTEVAIFDPTFAAFAYRPAGGGPDVVVPFGAAGPGQSLPVAAPPAPPIAAAVPTPAVGAASSPVRSAAVPGGPMASLATRRAARTLVLQASPGPLTVAN